MTHHITDEQIDELCLSLTGTYTRKERDRAVARAVLALAAPQGEPIGEIVRSFSNGSGLDVRLFGKLTSDTPGIVGTKLYTAPAPAVPSIDYMALIDAALVRHKYAQGTRACVAFKHGAEWFREQALTAAPTPPAQSEPVLVQHRKPIAGKDGETTGYTSWIDGKGLDWWPHRYLYAFPAPAQPAVPEDVERNAERYRWLRDMASQDWLHRNHNYQNLRGAAFDAAIDAARAAEKGGALIE